MDEGLGFVASVGGDGFTTIMPAGQGVVSGAQNVSLDGLRGAVLSCCAEGDWLVTGGADHELRVYSISQASLAGLLTGHWRAVLCCAMEGDWIVSGSADRHVKIWSICGGSLNAADSMATLVGHTKVERHTFMYTYMYMYDPPFSFVLFLPNQKVFYFYS